jgi:uncharacterized protein YbjT (DUF2867 family)
MDTILVLGATGLLGRPVAARLLTDGYQLRVLARDAGRARATLGPDVEVIQGDATDADSLQRAMAGCNGAHLSVGGPAELPSARLVADLAPRLGIERVTYLSGSTVDPDNAWYPLVEQKLAAEAALEASDVAHTILCPTWPMEQLPRFVQNGRAMVIGDRLPALHWFAAADLGRMVSRAFAGDEAAGRRLFVHGPEAMTMPEAVSVYCRARHPEIAEVSVVPIDAARARAEASGDRMLAFMAEMMSYFDAAGELGDAGEANRILGPNRTTLEAWIADLPG